MSLEEKVQEARKQIKKDKSVWRALTTRQKVKLLAFILVLGVEISGWTVLTIQIRQYATQTRAEYSYTMSEYEKAQVLLQSIKSKRTNDELVPTEDVEAESPVSIPTKDKERGASLSPSSGIEKLIYAYFKEDYKTAKAVFTAESHLNPKAQGWNCYYGEESRACKVEDRHRAWSVDCGLTQINVAGKNCPQELFNPDKNLRVARKKYDARTWRDWSTWKNKTYLAYL